MHIFNLWHCNQVYICIRGEVSCIFFYRLFRTVLKLSLKLKILHIKLLNFVCPSCLSFYKGSSNNTLFVFYYLQDYLSNQIISINYQLYNIILLCFSANVTPSSHSNWADKISLSFITAANLLMRLEPKVALFISDVIKNFFCKFFLINHIQINLSIYVILFLLSVQNQVQLALAFLIVGYKCIGEASNDGLLLKPVNYVQSLVTMLKKLLNGEF